MVDNKIINGHFTVKIEVKDHIMTNVYGKLKGEKTKVEIL